MPTHDLPSAELARSPGVDKLDWIASAPKDSLKASNLQNQPSDAIEFGLVDFGCVENQSILDAIDFLNDLPKASQSQATVCHADSLQNEASNPLGAKPTVMGEIADFNFNFDYSMAADAPSFVAQHEMPRYVSSPAQPFPKCTYPPPPDLAMEGRQPYPSPRAYPWGAAPTIPPLLQHDFRSITPPGKQISALDTSFLMYGSMGPPGRPHEGRKYNPLKNLADEEESDPQDLALSSAGTHRKRRTKRSRSVGHARTRKKARHDSIEKSLDTGSHVRQKRKLRNKGHDGNGYAFPSLPLSSTQVTRAWEAARQGRNAVSDYDGEADVSDMSIPTNMINAGYGQHRVKSAVLKTRMEAIKAQRRAYFRIPQDTSPDSPGHLHPISHPILEIQGRRRNHPGRKITIPQTPEVVARNARRRERYRSSLPPKQQALYDAQKPAAIPVTYF
ncbi:MAG: hypothetical protein Q9163_002352 [Psora crenata]